jgi:predicted nucleotidyltransferase
MEDKVLFETMVGSHAWGMNTPESDQDIIVIYQQSTYDILAGYPYKATKPHEEFEKNGVEYDYQYMEIGHLIDLLIKGNFNAILAVTSPVVLVDSPVLQAMRGITLNNLSKASYESITGMATSQFLDSKRRPKAKNMNMEKAYKTCLRTLNFGITMFETGELVYAPVNHVPSVEEIKAAYDDFWDARESTTLPDKPNELEFRNYLYYLRAAEI